MKPAFSKLCSASLFSIVMLLPGCDATAPLIPVATRNKIATLSRVNVELDIRRHSEWTPARREKAHAAARVLETVLNSNEFSRRLENRRNLQRTEGLSSAEILQIIRSGKTLSSLRAGDDAISKSIALALSVAPATTEYASFDGFTDLGAGIIYTRKEWFDTQSICQLAGLFAHEYMHVVGFSHATFYHPWLRQSVPYALGDMVTELAEKTLGAPCAALQ